MTILYFLAVPSRRKRLLWRPASLPRTSQICTNWEFAQSALMSVVASTMHSWSRMRTRSLSTAQRLGRADRRGWHPLPQAGPTGPRTTTQIGGASDGPHPTPSANAGHRIDPITTGPQDRTQTQPGPSPDTSWPRTPTTDADHQVQRNVQQRKEQRQEHRQRGPHRPQQDQRRRGTQGEHHTQEQEEFTTPPPRPSQPSTPATPSPGNDEASLPSQMAAGGSN